LELETRVRMNTKQLASGDMQLDVTAESSTVEKSKELIGQALMALVEEVTARGFKIVTGKK